MNAHAFYGFGLALPMLLFAAVSLAGEGESAEQAPEQTADQAHTEVSLEVALPEGFPAPGPADVVKIKHYPAYRVARAEGRNPFGQLFRHITKHGIAMTAPVEMTLEQEQGGAAGDAEGGAKSGAAAAVRPVDMMFMYAQPDMGELGPDDTVEVVDLPPVTVFSLGRFGDGGGEREALALEQVRAAVTANAAWELAGPARRFGYSSPFVPRERRYWEVQVPVRAVVEAQVEGEGEPESDSAGDASEAAG